MEVNAYGRKKAEQLPGKGAGTGTEMPGCPVHRLREFAGSQTMQQAFEQLIERQTCERFEEWMGQKPVKRLKSGENS